MHDSVTTQIKSNFSTITATSTASNGDQVVLPVERKTDNLNLKDKRDAIQYNYGQGKTGIYFLSGKRYDPDTGIDLQNDYSLNGSLPEWAVTGQYIEINNTFYIIDSILFDSNKNAEVLIIANTYTGSEAVIRVACSYNRFNYDFFEFTVAMSLFQDQNITVEITGTDADFSTVKYLSETINVQETQKDTLEIIYKNSTNTDILYATGIEHVLRVPFERKNIKIEDISETYKTDTTAMLLSSELFFGEEIEFCPLTKGITLKLLQALSHDTVYVNKELCVKNAAIEVEGPLEETNLYLVKAVMVKAEGGYTGQETEEKVFTSRTITEIPKLPSQKSFINIGGGFLKAGNGYISV